jgi:hypothetical protein
MVVLRQKQVTLAGLQRTLVSFIQGRINRPIPSQNLLKFVQKDRHAKVLQRVLDELLENGIGLSTFRRALDSYFPKTWCESTFRMVYPPLNVLACRGLIRRAVELDVRFKGQKAAPMSLDEQYEVWADLVSSWPENSHEDLAELLVANGTLSEEWLTDWRSRRA